MSALSCSRMCVYIYIWYTQITARTCVRATKTLCFIIRARFWTDGTLKIIVRTLSEPSCLEHASEQRMGRSYHGASVPLSHFDAQYHSSSMLVGHFKITFKEAVQRAGCGATVLCATSLCFSLFLRMLGRTVELSVCPKWPKLSPTHAPRPTITPSTPASSRGSKGIPQIQAEPMRPISSG